MRFVDRLGDQGRWLSHGRKHQHVHLLEDTADVAAALANALQGFDVCQRLDFLHLVQVTLGPGMVHLGRFVEKRLLIVVELDVVIAIFCLS